MSDIRPVPERHASRHFLVDRNTMSEIISPSGARDQHRPGPLPRETKALSRPGWQIVRDISMNILSRKASRLSRKPGIHISSLVDERSWTQKDTFHESEKSFGSSVVQRTPRMPTEKQALEIAIAHKLSCSFCEDACIDSYLRCRVCVRSYHSRCLFARGHSLSLLVLPRLKKQDWTCPDCRDLTRLINSNELHFLMQAFDHIDRNNDGLITMEEFLSFEPTKKAPEGFELFIQYNPELGRIYFRIMDRKKRGTVSWSDFSLFYTCKLLATKTKTELSMKLSDKELIQSKELFFKDPRKTIGNDQIILITQEHLRQVSLNILESLKIKYGKEFIDAILDYEHLYVATNDQSSMINWEEFLRETALLILLNRANIEEKSEDEINAQKAPGSAKRPAVLPHIFPSYPTKPPSRLFRATSKLASTPFLPNIDYDQSFRKHRRILEKLQRDQRDEDFRRRQLGSLVDCSIVESIDEEDDLNLPKLKPFARDDRTCITDPWTAVKDLQQLRRQPIFLRAPR